MNKPTGIEQTRADTETSNPDVITHGSRWHYSEYEDGESDGTFRFATGAELREHCPFSDPTWWFIRDSSLWGNTFADLEYWNQLRERGTLTPLPTVSAPEPSDSQVSPQPTVQKEDLNLEISRLRKALEETSQVLHSVPIEKWSSQLDELLGKVDAALGKVD